MKSIVPSVAFEKQKYIVTEESFFKQKPVWKGLNGDVAVFMSCDP